MSYFTWITKNVRHRRTDLDVDVHDDERFHLGHLYGHRR